MVTSFLASLSNLVSPSTRPPPAGLLTGPGCVPCVHTARHGLAHTQQQAPSLVPSAFLGTRIGFCLFFLPSSLSQEAHPKSGCPSGLNRMSRRGQWEEAGRQQPPAVSLVFSWAGAVAACPGASLALCTDGPGRASPPLYFTSFPCLSEPPYEAQELRAGDWLPHGVRETETQGLFFFLPGSSCHRHLDWSNRKGLKSKGHLASPTQEETTQGTWVINV